MSVFVSNSVTLTYGSTSQAFTALFADDDNFEIDSLMKERLDKTLLETIKGYRDLYSVRIQNITSAQRLFLYQFIQSEDQSITIFGNTLDVNLRDRELNLDLLDGYIDNIVLTMQFEDRLITVPTTPSRSQGVTTGSAGYSSIASGSGTVVTLFYDYGSGNTGRTFRVNRVTSYKAEILQKTWKYLDSNNGYKKLGYRLLFDIDFGGFGLGQTQAQLQDDRDWLKEFVLAPTKRIEVYSQYFADVVNDFNEVQYGYIGNSIYGKTVQLGFKAKDLATNAPFAPTDQAIFDFVLTDQTILG